ncbi:MAG: hypothetical protein AB7O59_17320 [Pirellulales bacterium]
MPRPYFAACCALLNSLILLAALPAPADDIAAQLAAIAKVGPLGAGSTAARAACDQLSTASATELPRLLVAMETPNPVAANWYRAAYEAIVARELAAPRPQFPIPELQSFVRDSKRGGRPRRLALALCDRLQPGFAVAVIPEFLDDPEFRDDAVDAALAAGQQALDKQQTGLARERFQKAYDHARTSDQVVNAAGKLQSLGVSTDIAAHLGLVVDWWVIGPFDAPQFSGFDAVYPPEKSVDLQAQYSGQDGRTLRWTRYHTNDPLGLADLALALAPAKEAVAYAYAELQSPRAMTAQLRCGADDNCSVWLNGERVFGRNQWLNGIRFDRFMAAVQLREGTNRVLVKVCQGPQHKNPEVVNAWTLYARFCDEAGQGVGLRSLLPAAEETGK